MRTFTPTKIAKNILIALPVMVGLYAFLYNIAFAAWEKSSLGIFESEVTSLAIHPKNSSVIFAGTTKGVYRSVDQGGNYFPVLLVRGNGQKVNAIYASPYDLGYVYAATDSGLYVATNFGYDWQKIYEAGNSLERHCLGIFEDGKRIYLGTTAGLFYKDLSQTHWQKQTGALGSQPVNFIVSDGKYLYFSLNNEVFRVKQMTQSFQKVFSLVSHQTNGEVEVFESSATDLTDTNKQIAFMHVNGNKTRLYLLTTKGVYLSRDHGESWDRIDSNGLPLERATSLSESGSGEIIVGTHNGAFCLTEGTWRANYQGMETNEINYLTHDVDGNLFAATNRGVFQLAKDQNAKTIAGKQQLPQMDFSNEPSVQDVQKMAIHYAEVDAEKILGWRRAAQNRAWFPTLSVGLDRDASEIFHWDTGTSPDSLLKGRDFMSWDVSVSWDLSDLVWSADQTSIDSRSKLMVELREDILDQVTRLYFERRRAQIELSATEQLSEIDRVHRELRIEELTALIDGFTGGKFSQKTQQDKNKAQNSNNKINSNDK